MSNKNTILLVGYCTPHSLGGRLAAGRKNGTDFGEEYDVLANIEEIDAYSAHADYTEMIGYLQNARMFRKLKDYLWFMAITRSCLNFKNKLSEAGFKDIYIPKKVSQWKYRCS